jgi:hypothetical protein
MPMAESKEKEGESCLSGWPLNIIRSSENIRSIMRDRLKFELVVQYLSVIPFWLQRIYRAQAQIKLK